MQRSGRISRGAVTPAGLRREAVRIAALYALLGGAWIIYSDRILASLVVDPLLLIRLQTAKGWLYVGVTALLLAWLINRNLLAAARPAAELEDRVAERTAQLEGLNRALRASEDRFRALYEEIPAMYFTVDSSGTVISANLFGAEQLGYSVQELTGRPVLNVFHEEDRQAVQEQFDACLRAPAGEAVSWEFRKRRKDGSILWVREFARATEDAAGNKVVLIVCLDITDGKLADEEIVRLNAELRRHGAELEEANRKLTELDRLKSMFIASTSHELRTPLNSIIGFSSILLDEWIGPLTDEQKENLATVLRAGKHLLALINDIIDISKVEAGQIDRQISEFDLGELLEEAGRECADEAATRGIELRIEPVRLFMHTERRRLYQCVLNLVSNGVKYTERGSVVVTAQPSGAGRVTIAVTDTGIGIREEDRPRLFEPFSRLDSPLKSRVPGTGLGLYLTRKLAREVLGGEVALASRPGEGSSFFLTIPVRSEEGGIASGGTP
ncbi:PAS domain-containing hybrid sensor histidine kinase/response regulator [Geobacter sp.]|uniref:PAS domain-containing sensor histidine kinase n=1 Tax=Geobacter sp. TaxID=46610 RepID=UPI002617F3F8|nr:PAS domain-containing hybrid sensor histidine kinase/response regulator [Geobacter sp.]